MDNQTQFEVKGWLHDGVLFEYYRYGPGPPDAIPKHFHEEYQLCLSLDFPGEYFYRGAYHSVPVGSLSILHPGEVHFARDPEYRHHVTAFRMMYLQPEKVREIAGEIAGRETALPFFQQPIILNKTLFTLFLNLHRTIEGPATWLEQESLFLVCLTHLIVRYAQNPPSSTPIRPARLEVQRARDYLVEHWEQNIALSDLAQVAGLSPFHLSREFRRQLGLPPHLFQTQLRLTRAKALLARGLEPGQVAAATGFYDQSHLAAHFKRLVGTTPARYPRF